MIKAVAALIEKKGKYLIAQRSTSADISLADYIKEMK